jgi:TRAP-type mannitol/chloroaromatic compound transport system substrate-binding protein
MLPDLAKLAVAQDAPEVRWRMASSFPKSLETLYGGALEFARVVGELSDGRFEIQVFGPGEIVPGLQVLDAVGNSTVQSGQTALFYYVGKSPALAFATDVPFGLSSRLRNAWLYQGGAIELLNELLTGFNVYGLPAGNSGCQMGGWFRREIRTPDDVRGLKFRIGGLAGQVWQKVGAVPQQIAAGDIYPALERGTIDAAEWVGPYDDERLGFHKVAEFYYYPGWWEGGSSPSIIVNLAEWDRLPKRYKAIWRYAAAWANHWILAKYDMVNPPALRRLVAQGTQLRPFSPELMEAFRAAAEQLYAELSAKDAMFKRLHDHMRAFQKEAYLWYQVADYSFDTFQIRSRGKS